MNVQDFPELTFCSSLVFFVCVLVIRGCLAGKVNREADLFSLRFGHWISFIVYKRGRV